MENKLTVFRPIKNDDKFIINVLSITQNPPRITLSEGDKYLNSKTLKLHTYKSNKWDNGVIASSNNVFRNTRTKKTYRIIKNIITETDYVEFPNLGEPLELYDFTYSSQRMGKAPTITASAMWKICLDNYWSLDCFVIFNNERFYLNKIPTSSKNNTDARYKHDLDFLSERVVLEDVYLFDVVTPYISERPTSENITFSFFGDINDLRKRINASLVNSGVSSYVFRKNVTYCPTLKEWNNWGLEPVTSNHHKEKYLQYNGNYSKYLQTEIYEYKDGEFTINGYQVVIGNDKDGKKCKSKEEILSFDKSTVFDALTKIDEVFKLKYYFKGKNIIIGDAENFISDEIFEYGYNKALLSATKQNDTEKIITKCSGIGSSENIPYYYPNPTEDGTLSIKLRNKNSQYVNFNAEIKKWKGYAVDSYLKNRLSDSFIYGNEEILKPKEESIYTIKDSNNNNSHAFYHALYEFQVESKGNFYFDSEFPTIGTNYDIGAFYNDDYVNIIPDNFAIGTIIKVNKKGTIIITLQQQLSNLEIQHIGYYNNLNETINGVMYEPCFLQQPNTKPGVLVKTKEQDGRAEWDYNEYLVYIEDYPEFMAKHTHSGEHIYFSEKIYIYKDLVHGTKQYVKPMEINNGERCFDMKSNKVYQYNLARNPKFSIVSSSRDYEDICKILLNENKLKLCFYQDGWFKKGRMVNLNDFGIIVTGTPIVNDIIEFNRDKYLTPQGNLMPQVYYNTDGEKRFYFAKNYPIENATELDANKDFGEVIDNGIITNPLYENDDEKKPNQYKFTNEYKENRPKEYVGEFQDIKPTIVGIKNNNRRIDIVEEFAYDDFDNNETWIENEGDSNSLEYKHPHFYAKLRPLGFNLFDCAIDSGEMILSMTKGDCGACNFKIKVDSKTQKNPVQIWEEDIYEKKSENTYILLFKKGDLKRNYKEKELYIKNIQGEYQKINSSFFGNTYLSSEITSGSIGNYKIENKEHAEGDVVNYGTFQKEQQDTTNNYVWVALEKDINTYGVIMPSAKPTYSNGEIDVALSSYIRPKSYKDALKLAEDLGVNVQMRPAFAENNSDTFVLINILLPQFYIREAEKKLSKEIIKCMADHNNWKYNFSIDFSRIYLAENLNIFNALNENSKIKIRYNNIDYIEYVSSYTYKVSSKEALPEISIDLRENINTIQYDFIKNIIGTITSDITGTYNKNEIIETVLSETSKRYITKNDKMLAILENEIRLNGNTRNLISSLKLDGGPDTISINELRDKNIALTEENKKLISENTKLIERSNEMLTMLNQLDASIQTFNSRVDGTNVPQIDSWTCVNQNGICKPMPELKPVFKPELVKPKQ